MCGRYTHLFTWAELHALMELVIPGKPITPRYNFAPTQDAPIIRFRSDGNLHGDFLKWGLIPSWSKDKKFASSLINARSETVAEKPSFRSAFKQRRCLVPASGYYEWKQEGAIKQPFYITRLDGNPLLFAGIWESWRTPEESPLETFSILTTNSNSHLSWIHDRMPVILSIEDTSNWLNLSYERVSDLLRPLVGEQLRVQAVSTRVNSARNEGAECIEPIEHEVTKLL